MRIVVMGVTGCGKSTVGAAVAAELGLQFADADDFHPAANIAKMAAGKPLGDDDRWPWLDAVGDWIGATPGSIMACSALKRSYRNSLKTKASDLVFVHLTAPQSELDRRVRLRSEQTGHFASAALLDSQFATLEPLGFDEVGASIDVSERDDRGAVLAVLDALEALHA